MERTILDHYKLSSPYPNEWPADKDTSDASDEEDEASKSSRNGSMAAKLARRKSKYFALEKASDRRSLIPNAQKSGDGVETLVQRDEPDPLGSTDSVVRILRQQGLPVQDDIALRLYLYYLPEAFTDGYQVIGFSYHLQHSHLPCFSRKSILLPLRKTYYKD